MGHWCGYVVVPEGHPAHDKGYDEVDDSIDVHGGLTFADRCQEGPIDQTVCHLPAPGEPDHLWWLGFDCAHYGDLMPAARSYLDVGRYGVYRDLSFVQEECRRLAKQLAAMV